MRIKLTVGYPNWGGIRQTPRSQGIWEDCKFLINQSCEECDAWVVLQSTKGLLTLESTHCPPENLVLVTREPPDMMTWQSGYLKQFNVVVSCHTNLKHSNVLLTQHGQTWHLANYSYDQLIEVQPDQKIDRISIICSNKNYTLGHRTRLRLLEILKGHFKELDIFGYGFNPILDKWEGIYPYKYHLVLENGSFPHYWTEKLTDAYLGFSLPIYCGCPNLTDYFSAQSFIQINSQDIDRVIDTLEQAISNHQYERSLPAVMEARNLVLNHYNLFPMLAELCRQLPGTTKQKVTLRPDFEFKPSFVSRISKLFSPTCKGDNFF
ncbi:MAG: hypothetical protein KME16_04395 [Scytolyngbya sp. HA4215-MV1]|jgi:hypothetical protein|nr:hypothetical protein [Scytolyngbya sp. HA4215-MV1]